MLAMAAVQFPVMEPLLELSRHDSSSSSYLTGDVGMFELPT